MEKWPDYFPENAPPEDAIPTGGKVYRLVSNFPPLKNDFEPVIIENTGFKYPNLDPVMACGTSFHSDLKDSKITRDRYKRLRDKKIVTGKLNTDFGVMKKTPSQVAKSHITVWFFEGAEPHLQINEEVEE